jgi:hypothetical protein
MADAPAKAAPRKQVPESDKLDPSEVHDERDTSPRLRADTSGKRVRAIPAYPGQTTAVVLKASDFAAHDVDHPQVEFNFRKDDFTLPVGKKGGLSEEAADFLTENFPEQFEYMNE